MYGCGRVWWLSKVAGDYRNFDWLSSIQSTVYWLIDEGASRHPSWSSSGGVLKVAESASLPPPPPTMNSNPRSSRSLNNLTTRSANELLTSHRRSQSTRSTARSPSRHANSILIQSGSRAIAHDCFRVALLGAPASGKTTLATRMTRRVFIETYTPTVEDTSHVTLDVDGAPIAFTIIDTGGHRTKATDTGDDLSVKGVLLVFSLKNRATYEYIADCFEPSRYSSAVLVATHADCNAHERAVSVDEVKSLAFHLGVPFAETSALSHRCTSVFYTLGRLMRHHALPEQQLRQIRLEALAATEFVFEHPDEFHTAPPTQTLSPRQRPGRRSTHSLSSSRGDITSLSTMHHRSGSARSLSPQRLPH